MGGRGAGGVDVEDFPRPEIKFRWYLSSRAKCAHVLSAPVFHSRHDEEEAMNYVFLVCVKYTSALSLVVAPRSDKFGGNMVVIIACYFSNKG